LGFSVGVPAPIGKEQLVHLTVLIDTAHRPNCFRLFVEASPKFPLKHLDQVFVFFGLEHGRLRIKCWYIKYLDRRNVNRYIVGTQTEAAMAKHPGNTLEEDHAFLVAVLTDIRNKLKKDGKLLAGDRQVFQEKFDADMPTLLETLDGYIDERT